jgi:hypothetical protein
VTSYHQQKIHLDQEYPCPCHLNGKLQQMVLTEAFACNRCRRIFVLQEDGLTIEELAVTYPYKRRYYWDGTRFQVFRTLPKGAIWAFFRSPERLSLWLQCLGVISLVMVLFQLYCRVILTIPIFNLVLSMAIAIVVLTITLWLFDQG